MPRNGSGVYTPVSNSFTVPVSSTTISSAGWAAGLADLATALTNSLASDGQTTATVRIPFAQGAQINAGLVGTPALNFVGATTTGLYLSAANEMGVTANGTLTARFASTGVTVPGTLTITGISTFTGALTANGGVVGNVTGNLTGNVTGNITGSAAKWTTGRTITLTGDATGVSGAFDGSGNLSFAVTGVQSAKLTTARSISITGDMTWTVSFDGSGAVTAAGTLATVNANTGTWGSSTMIPAFTVNGKGLITAASQVALSLGVLVRSARTSNTILGLGDQGTLVDVTSGSFTQSLTAAATLGSGWWCYYRNSGTGDVTLDPNGAETIDGLASYLVYPNEVRLIQCDGSALRTMVVQGFDRTFTASGTLTMPPGYARIGMDMIGAGGGGGSGMRAATGTERPGGTGGGGGARIVTSAPAPAGGASCTITVGTAGTGGTGQTVDSTAGANGAGGTVSSFAASGLTTITAYGGGRGAGGNNAQTSGGGGGGVAGAGVDAIQATNTASGGAPLSTVAVSGGGGTSNNNGNAAEWGGGAGGPLAGVAASNGQPGGDAIYGGPGGGCGGGAVAANTAQSGKNGGGVGTYATGGGGAGGANTGAVGTAGTTPSLGGPGTAGGGAGGLGAFVGGAGGIGAGGGGGSGSSNGTTSGAGGAGGRGEVRVWGIV